MGINNLDIRVNGGQSVFYPGQMVQGNVHLDVESDTKVRGPGEDQVIMKPGSYTYAFGMQLPDQCATSFEGSIGQVRYYLKAIVDRPWAFDNKHFHPITVIQVLDLNRRTDVLNTVQNQGSKTLCCLCCESGPVTGKLFLNRIGYVPGEKIMVEGEVCNHSRRAMKNHQINLLMNVHYHAYGKTRTVPTEVAELRKIEIPPGESESWNGEGLVIPPLPASGLPGCSIITIDYTVELQVVPTGIAFDLSIPVPIIIGSIPLVSVVQQFGAPMNRPNPVPAPEPKANPSAPPPSYADIYHNDPAYPPPPQAMMPDNIPPPSFGRSVLGAMSGGYREENEVDDENEPTNSDQPTNQPFEQNWSPMYPFYDWNRPDANFTVREKEQKAKKK